MAENYVKDECFDFELEENTIVNVVDYITNNEYEHLEILVEEEFTSEEFQIIEENKCKLPSCLLQEIPMLTTDVNVESQTLLFVKSVGSPTENRSFMKFT